MAEASEKFAIRVGLDGGEAVQAGLAAIAQAGQNAMAQVQQSTSTAGQSLERFTRTANDNAQQVSRLATSFSTFETQTKSVGRAVSDAAGALQLFGGAGSQADKSLGLVRNSLGGIADVAGSVAGAFGGSGAGLVGILTRFAGVIGIAVTAYQAFRLVTGQSAQSQQDAKKATEELDAAYRRLAQGAESATERQERQRRETIEGIQADLNRVRSLEEVNRALAANNLASAQARSSNILTQLVEEERVLSAAGERATAVQRARVEALREQARALSTEVENATGAINRAQSGVARATGNAENARTNAMEQFGPPASLASRARERSAAVRQEAGALEESLNRLAAAAGQVRIPTEQLDEARRILEATRTPAERYAETFARLNELLASGAINQETFNRAVGQAQQTMERADGSAESLRRTSRELGLTFSSAFEDAVLKGKKLREVLQGILQDIARIILRRTVTEPLGNAVSGILGSIFGGGTPGGAGQTPPTAPGTATGGTGANAGGIFSALAGLFGSANGNVFGPGGLERFAQGGIVNRPTIFPFARGVGLMGEAGPEAIMPLMRNSRGQLGVAANSNGGGSPINQTIHLDLRGSSLSLADVEARVRAGMRQANAELIDEIQRNPAVARRVRGR